MTDVEMDFFVRRLEQKSNENMPKILAKTRTVGSSAFAFLRLTQPYSDMQITISMQKFRKIRFFTENGKQAIRHEPQNEV